MRQFSAQFASHIASGATTLCNCWLIERSDGVNLGFTDHDQILEFGGQQYLPANGLDSSEISAKLGSQVDTSEVTGILHSASLSEEDILLGRYRDARVTTIRVNWRDVFVREIMRVDVIGEIAREDQIFRAELRSQQEILNIPKGRRYQSGCDTSVGSTICGIDIDSPPYSGDAVVEIINSRYSIEISGLGSFASGWFSFGTADWVTGKRALLKDSIKSHNLSGANAILTFEDPVGDWAVIGDQLSVFVGCNRLFSTCKSKFANSVNFQGFPHIPGNGFLLSYPLAGDDLNGSALIK
ncbi:MAG: DUF2163 domain-containing protein [Devosiaceae bacterium]|nr:DUF2163 domain-containing protein [Devosiaceae bacterium]